MAKKQKQEIEFNEKMLQFFAEAGTMGDLVDVKEDHLEAVYSLGYHLYDNGKYEDAEKAFALLLFYDHTSRKFWLAAGAAQQMQKKYKEALQSYGFAAQLDIHEPSAHMYAADCFLAIGDKANAKNALRTVLEVAGGSDKKEHVQLVKRAGGILEILEKAAEKK